MTITTVEPPRIYPTFRFRNPARMIDFLQQAFGFRIRAKYGDGDAVSHAELALGSSIIMCGQVRDDDYGRLVGGPNGQGGKSLYIAVDDADAAGFFGPDELPELAFASTQAMVNRIFGAQAS